jgi:hypothetical protein
VERLGRNKEEYDEAISKQVEEFDALEKKRELKN